MARACSRSSTRARSTRRARRGRAPACRPASRGGCGATPTRRPRPMGCARRRWGAGPRCLVTRASPRAPRITRRGRGATRRWIDLGGACASSRSCGGTARTCGCKKATK
eukprot:2025585-Rhodomonas_salina.3